MANAERGRNEEDSEVQPRKAQKVNTDNAEAPPRKKTRKVKVEGAEAGNVNPEVGMAAKPEPAGDQTDNAHRPEGEDTNPRAPKEP